MLNNFKPLAVTLKGLCATVPLAMLGVTLANLGSVKSANAATVDAGAPVSSVGDLSFIVDISQNQTLTVTPLPFEPQEGSVTPFSSPSDVLSFGTVTFSGLGAISLLAANFPTPPSPGTTLTYAAANGFTGGTATYNINFPAAVPEPSYVLSALALGALMAVGKLKQASERNKSSVNTLF